jgi:hypothetical protein
MTIYNKGWIDIPEGDLSTADIARRYKVGVMPLCRAIAFFEGFPKSRKVRQANVFNAAAVDAWMDGKDIHELVRMGERFYKIKREANVKRMRAPA